MKVLSLTEPWAELVAIGAKCVETRSWPARYRGMLAIHATKEKSQWPYHPETLHAMVSALIPFQPDPGEAQKLDKDFNPRITLPHGAIVATCQLVDCTQVGSKGELSVPAHKWLERNPREKLFGDWSPGRWLWLLDDIQRLETPIPIKGHQGLWNWDEKGLHVSRP